MTDDRAPEPTLANYFAQQARAELEAVQARCCPHGIHYDRGRCTSCPDPDELETCQQHAIEFVPDAGCPTCRTDKELA